MAHVYRRAASVALILSLLSTCACARMDRRVGLRLVPVGTASQRTVVVGKGLSLTHRRTQEGLEVSALAVSYCMPVTSTRVQGFRVVKRAPVGRGLLYEWLMGGLITATGAGLLAYNAAADAPSPDTLELDYRARGWWYAGGITAAGLALLTGAAVQQSSVGVIETPLGQRTVKTEGAVSACRPLPATSGSVRLTLDEGPTYTAELNADGKAVFLLSEQVKEKLARGSRKATLEALGDWRSQVRVKL